MASLEQHIAQAERERDEAVDARIKEVQRVRTTWKWRLFIEHAD